MGKIAVASTVGATGATVSLGGAYVLGAFNSRNLDIPVSLEKFKTVDEGSIVGAYFPGVLLNSEGSDWGTDNKPATNFLGNSTPEARGRLVVNWEKLKCSSDDKRAGRIRWLWTFVNGDKGLALYASAKTSSDASKLDAEGVIYSLSKETNGWTIKHNKKSSSTPVQVDDSDSKFPMVSDTFKSTDGLKVKDYWGFTDSTNKFTKFCKWETSHDSSKEFEKEFKGSWTWKPETGKDKKPFDWSKASHQWITTFYGTPDPTLETLVNSFSGIWTEEYFVNKDLGVTVS